MPVEFGVLGTVEARLDGEPLDLGHARQPSVLSILLVEANHAVYPDQLIDRLWGERPPHTARNTLHGYLHRLRQALPGVPIDRGPNGYLLAIDPETVDLHRFRRLVGQARTRCRCWTRRWRCGVASRSPACPPRGSTTCATASSGTGSPPSSTVPAPPSTPAATVKRLVDELGVDPGPALSELHQRLLTGDLDHEPAPVPRQLPARPVLFSGRAGDLAQLDKALDSRPGRLGDVHPAGRGWSRGACPAAHRRKRQRVTGSVAVSPAWTTWFRR